MQVIIHFAITALILGSLHHLSKCYPFESARGNRNMYVCLLWWVSG